MFENLKKLVIHFKILVITRLKSNPPLILQYDTKKSITLF